MPDQRTRDFTARDGAAAIGTQARVAPSSSRMLTSYMTDIEQLLDEQHWEAALREALELPRIAVALSDPHLSVSGERLKARGVTPGFARKSRIGTHAAPSTSA